MQGLFLECEAYPDGAIASALDSILVPSGEWKLGTTTFVFSAE